MPGRVLRELTENARIMGGMTPACAERAREFYRIFVQGECILTSARTAELAKLAENAYRDVNIAFANELSSVCDQLDIDVWELIRLSNHHPRVNILQPGPGVGGHCIAVDPWFIVAAAPQQAKLIRTAREVNDARPQQIVARIRTAVNRFDEPRIACLGLAFKPNIDDLRHSPAVEIVETLAAELIGKLLVVEPHIQVLPESLSTQANVQLATLDEALESADVVVLLVHHRPFVDVDPSRLDGKEVVDTRGIWR
jgi:UDP-N-acetyl-D-mannosaminuronic acid dehydrogenase